jgi:hypothetical protein
MKRFKSGGKWYGTKPRKRRVRARGASAGSPIDIEFATGRLDPLLRDYADLVRKAYRQANHHFWTHDVFDPCAFGANVGANDDEDGDAAEQIGEIDTIFPSPAHDPCDPKSPSKVGAELIAALTLTAPVDRGEGTTDPAKLFGPEIGANAVLVCQRIKYRAAHLWNPMIDAVVFGYTMTEIGRSFGGNSGDAAKLGREKVRDGLLFAKLVFDDLIREEREDERKPKKRRVPRFAMGTDDLPLKWQQAENDNRRCISDVA